MIQHEYYYRSRLVLPGQKPQWLSDSEINVNGTTIPLSWSQPLNWVGGVPNAAGAEANFWRTLTTIAAITLDGSKTIGKLSFDSPFNFTLTAGTGGSLILNNSGSTATLSSNQGTHTIDVGVQLASGLNATINAGTFTISGAVSGAGGLTKSGVGILSLTGTNSYAGNTNVVAGKLSLSNRGLADAADVSISERRHARAEIQRHARRDRFAVPQRHLAAGRHLGRGGLRSSIHKLAAHRNWVAANYDVCSVVSGR